MTRTRTIFRRGAVLMLLLGLGGPGCGGDAGDAGPRTTWSASAAQMCQARPDETTAGCFAAPSSMLCSPTGCQSLCAGGRTPVICSSGQSTTGEIPGPDVNGGCTIVAIPTPQNELFYCCPCGAT